jgi:hypothetical protein
MGFMDKAKKLAEQAQEKLDEAQKQFNTGQGGTPGQGAEGGQATSYDEHGRPVQGGPPAGETAPPEAQPESEQARPAEPEKAPEPAEAPPGEGTDTNPDPFKPIQ